VLVVTYVPRIEPALAAYRADRRGCCHVKPMVLEALQHWCPRRCRWQRTELFRTRWIRDASRARAELCRWILVTRS